MPLAADTFGGQLTVSTGSTRATSGPKNGLLTPCFTLSFSLAKMATLVTSEPVPAVVGTAITGRPFFSTMSMPTKSSTVLPGPGRMATILAVSMAEPPPKATMASYLPFSANLAASSTLAMGGSGTDLS